MVSREELLKYKIAYYSGNPLISDQEYDDLEAVWKQENPTDELPVDMGQITSVFDVPYISLRKLGSEQVTIWCGNQYSNLTATPKIDGVSMELKFVPDENGMAKLEYAKTRGGVDRTDAFLRSVVFDDFTEIPISFPIIVRGECFLRAELHGKVKELGYKNPRNLVSGLINSDDGNEFNGEMSFLIWNWINTPLNSYSMSLKYLYSLGFETVPLIMHFLDESQLKDLEDEEVAEYYKKVFPYEIDGIVLWKDNLESWGNDEGRSTYTNAVAWKFPAQYAESTILDVVWSTGNSGYITPVAKVEPVEIGGVTVSSINLFNPRNLTELNIKIGSTAKIRRAGDVIPHIMEPCEYGEDLVDVVVPECCPTCGAEVKIEGPRIKCGSDLCDAVFVGVLKAWADLHEWKFFSDDAIKLLKPYFKEDPSIHPIVKIYQLTQPILLSYMTPGKAARLWKHLEEARTKTTAATLIASLNIPMVGLKIAEGMMIQAGTMVGLLNVFRDSNITTKIYVAENNAITWMEENSDYWNQIVALGVYLDVNQFKKKESVSTRGKVVVTGTLPGLSRKEAFDIIKQLGWEPTESLNKETSYLISEKVSNSSKFKKAAELGVQAITWQAFLDLHDSSVMKLVGTDS